MGIVIWNVKLFIRVLQSRIGGYMNRDGLATPAFGLNKNHGRSWSMIACFTHVYFRICTAYRDHLRCRLETNPDIQYLQCGFRFRKME